MLAWAMPVDPAGLPQPKGCQVPLTLRMLCLRTPVEVTSTTCEEPFGMPAMPASITVTPGWASWFQPCQEPVVKRMSCSSTPLLLTATSWLEPLGMAVMSAWVRPVDPAGEAQSCG